MVAMSSSSVAATSSNSLLALSLFFFQFPPPYFLALVLFFTASPSPGFLVPSVSPPLLSPRFFFLPLFSSAEASLSRTLAALFLYSLSLFSFPPSYPQLPTRFSGFVPAVASQAHSLSFSSPFLLPVATLLPSQPSFLSFLPSDFPFPLASDLSTQPSLPPNSLYLSPLLLNPSLAFIWHTRN